MNKLLIIPLIILSLSASAEVNDEIQQLEQQLAKAKEDTAKVWLYIGLCSKNNSLDVEKAAGYADQALQLATKLDYANGIAASYKAIGTNRWYAGELDKAAEHYLSGLRVYEEIGDQSSVASTLEGIGNVYELQEKYEKALEYQLSSLALKQELQDSVGIKRSMTNLGSLYYQQDLFDKALTYFTKALEIGEALNDSVFIATGKSNIAVVYAEQGNFEAALGYQLEVLEYNRNAGNKSDVVISLLNIGLNHKEMKKYDKALEYLEEALVLAQEVNQKPLIIDCYYDLSITHEAMGNYEKAYDYQAQMFETKSEMLNAESDRNMQEVEAIYQVEKKEKDNEILRQQAQIDEAEKSRQRITIWAGAGGMLLVLVVAFQLFRANAAKRKTNAELAERNATITEQKEEITDSIEYAQYIQQAVLPRRQNIAEHFKDSFVILLPKDVVSGDFYWFNTFGQHAILALADCTGHGVPGGFMSMMGAEMLNQVIADPDMNDPGQALGEIDRRIKNNLNQAGAEQQRHDGMDMAICVFDSQNMHMQFSGANRPLVRVRDGELTMFEPNKYGVGGMHQQEKKFGTERIELQTGDCFYMYSDGYPDQFGGPKGKKFMRKKLNDLLSELATAPMAEQEEELIKRFHSWRGDLEQIDDVSLVGVRV